MSSQIRKCSVSIAGHATSISLEEDFWLALKAIAARQGVSLNALIAGIDCRRGGNLSSALRVVVLKDLQALLAAASLSADPSPRGPSPDPGSPASFPPG